MSCKHCEELEKRIAALEKSKEVDVKTDTFVPTFRKGDKVECVVDGDSSELLHKDKIYIIESDSYMFDGREFCKILGLPNNSWLVSRFKKYVEPIKYTFQPGDKVRRKKSDIETTGRFKLEYNKIYTVKSSLYFTPSDERVILEEIDSNIPSGWFANRFEKYVFEPSIKKGDIISDESMEYIGIALSDSYLDCTGTEYVIKYGWHNNNVVKANGQIKLKKVESV